MLNNTLNLLFSQKNNSEVVAYIFLAIRKKG